VAVGAHHQKTEIIVIDQPTQNLLGPPLDRGVSRASIPAALSRAFAVLQPLLRRRRFSPTVTTVTDSPAKKELRAIWSTAFIASLASIIGDEHALYRVKAREATKTGRFAVRTMRSRLDPRCPLAKSAASPRLPMTISVGAVLPR
jgi:hypothetical protein